MNRANSPSQDSSPHPGDYFQSRYVTPGFKPFPYLRSLQRRSEKRANDYISYARKARCIKQQLWFNHRCKDLGLVPAGLRINALINSKLQHPSPPPPRAFELLKIGSFKFPPPRAKIVFKCPTLSSIYLSKAPPKEQSSSVPVVCTLKHANTCLVTLYMMMPFAETQLSF